MCESHPYYWVQDLLGDFGTVLLHSDNTVSFKCENESFRTFLKELYCTLISLKGNTNLYETDELLAQFIELYSFKYDLSAMNGLSVRLLISFHLVRGLRFRTDLLSYDYISNENELMESRAFLKDAIEVIIDIYSKII